MWCGASLAGRRKDALYCSASCRATAARERKESAQSRNTAPPRANRSGLQISYRKAVEHIALSYGPGLRRSEAIARAEALLRPALSDRQRAQLDERS